ncbi:translocation and assembly module lipoprotein TamL [Breznakibacter xylanolyticus]|nr:BamA/TamA family outer membrane protein [Breznakibacter xylanolyticus]
MRYRFFCFSNGFWLVLIVVGVSLLSGCRTTRYVPDGEQMLARTMIHSPIRDISMLEMKSYLRQRENVKILGFWKAHLGIYNLSGADTSKWVNKVLRRIGEEPVLYDEVLTRMSRDQLQRLMHSKGFFTALVTDTVIPTGKKKVKVVYTIHPSRRYRIDQMGYRVDDDSMRAYVLADTSRSLLRRGRPFDAALHDEERDRITSRLRNQGYYAFNKDYISFSVDSALGRYAVVDSLILSCPLPDGASNPNGTHRRYYYRNVYYIISETPQRALLEGGFQGFDTLSYEGNVFLFEKNIEVHPTVLISSSYLSPGERFNAFYADRTQMLLSGLAYFRYVDIRYKDVTTPDDENGWLDCYIQMVPARKQVFSVEVEGTNSSGNLGAGGNLRYQHRNLWRGAEVLDVGFRMSQERQFVRNTTDVFNTSEYGVEVGLEVPKFWLPFEFEGFRKRFTPKTNIQAVYSYQHRPDYTRTIANLRYGYNWRSSRYVTHTFNPAEFNLVWLPYVNDDFWKYISGTFLRYSYEDHFILNSSYAFQFNNQSRTRQTEYWFARINMEGAGNFLRSLVSLWEKPDENGHYRVMDIQFSQYVKGDVDVRYHHAINRANTFAYRLFAGVGYPYGNTKVLPFEKRYFSGGANSLRAWPVRGVGPGTFVDTVSAFYNQTADIKLELNAEYRFKMFWVLEGALFADAGNIWGIRSDASLPGGLFEFDEFYKEIAIGVGAGIRLDFNYFLFRMDAGVKARDPIQPVGKRWVLANQPFGWNDLTFNFAIGYPF